MSVRTFAQTYPQLMSQALNHNLVEADLMRLRSAYEMAEDLFDGLYRAQHVPFICHLVRTASVLLEEKASIETVIAGLLHAAYSVGYFKDQKHGGATQEHRDALRSEVGEPVEALVFGYFNSRWYRKECVHEYLRDFDLYDPSQREILVVHLANELEDYLDLGMAYRGIYPYQDRIEAYGKEAVELAIRLGHPKLAAELETVFHKQLDSRLPRTVKTGQYGSYQLPMLKWLKKDYLERFWIRSKAWLKHTAGDKEAQVVPSGIMK